MGDSPAAVTVGIPVHNGERWLGEAIDSVLAQTYDDFILSILDNASTDKTQAICKHYAAQDQRVRYSRNDTNIGVFANYDRVFENSSTRYFKWASSNDVCGMRFLESCIDMLEANPDVVVAYPRTALFDQQLEDAEPYEDGLCVNQDSPAERIAALLANLKLNNLFNGVIRSDVLRKTRLNRAHTGSDIDLVAELSLYGKMIEVPDLQFFRRMNPSASSILVPEEERSDYFSNESRDVLEFRQLRIESGLFAAVLRTSLPTSEKFKIARYLLRHVLQNRDKLLSESKSMIRDRLSRVNAIGRQQ